MNFNQIVSHFAPTLVLSSASVKVFRFYRLYAALFKPKASSPVLCVMLPSAIVITPEQLLSFVSMNPEFSPNGLPDVEELTLTPSSLDHAIRFSLGLGNLADTDGLVFDFCSLFPDYLTGFYRNIYQGGKSIEWPSQRFALSLSASAGHDFAFFDETGVSFPFAMDSIFTTSFFTSQQASLVALNPMLLFLYSERVEPQTPPVEFRWVVPSPYSSPQTLGKALSKDIEANRAFRLLYSSPLELLRLLEAFANLALFKGIYVRMVSPDSLPSQCVLSFFLPHGTEALPLFQAAGDLGRAVPNLNFEKALSATTVSTDVVKVEGGKVFSIFFPCWEPVLLEAAKLIASLTSLPLEPIKISL